MAGTSWDKLGQVEAVFDAVGPAIHEAADAAGARVREFHNEDPIWRVTLSSDVYVDVVWDEATPDVLAVRSIRWVDDKPHSEQVGQFQRDHDVAELKELISRGLG